MIKSVEELAEVLEANGYEAMVNGNAVFTKVGGSSTPYTAVIEYNSDNISISCELARLGEFEEEQLPQVFAAALSANTVIDPFAFAIIDETDDDSITSAEEYSLILTDSMPISDLSPEELIYAMEKLWAALTESARVLRSAMVTA